MNKEFFLEQMARTAISTTQFPKGAESVYWSEFGSWTDNQFAGAMQRCRNDLIRFPKVAEIRERFSRGRVEPKVVEQPLPVVAGHIETDADTKGTDDLESRINALTKQEIFELVKNDGLLDDHLVHDVVMRFLANPKNATYRGYIKDIVCPDWDRENHVRYRHPPCRDRGTLEVYSGNPAYRELKNGTFDPVNHIRIVKVACTCDAGEYHTQPIKAEDRNRCQPLRRFDSTVMCITTECTQERQAIELREWFENRKPHNHHEEFSDWVR